MSSPSPETAAKQTGLRPLAEQIESTYERIGVTGAHKQVVFMILLGVFFDALEQNAVGITGPVLRESWGLDASGIGFLNTMTFTATALGRIATGLIVDRFGRRNMLTVNLIIFAVGSLICAFAPSYAVLAAGRFIVGFGLGGEIAVAVIMMAEFFSAKHRGTAVGLINVTAAGLGNMLAPAFGILVFTLFDGPDKWRWLFGLLFLPALLVMWFRRYVPETPRYLAATGQIDKCNEVLNRLATGKLAGAVPANEQYIIGAEQTQAATGSAGGTWKQIFTKKLLPRTIMLVIAVGMSYAAQISMLTLMPMILVSLGYAVNTSLWFTLLMQTGSLLGALTASVVANRFPRKLVLTLASVLGCGSGLAIAFMGSNIIFVLIFGVVFNYSIIVLNTTIWLFAPEQYPTRVRGFGTSIILAAGSLSGGLFPLIAGAVFDAGGIAAMFSVMAGLFVVLAISIRFVPETFGKPLQEDDNAIYGH
ncbi:MFS transporter [Glutamicibacter uratoxydans]|uniref:MFS transporter n=1 Tax=Glutamicibacter uratoxydans TaxID=43667 RepID=A0A4Y4DR87_GLUUR|nr:MFS transporter [Glutamicibacter uratoxydans]GED07456.1 MFS transporter [Glutamicibacter uratoxydans]